MCFLDLKHRNKKRGLLQAVPDKARDPNVVPGNASVPTCLGPIGSIWCENQMTATQILDPGSNFGGSNVVKISGPQEEAPDSAQVQVDNWNLEDWDEFIRDCPLI
ncbi:hypothetical protein ACFE04_026816 [Oxalis oulophora]